MLLNCYYYLKDSKTYSFINHLPDIGNIITIILSDFDIPGNVLQPGHAFLSSMYFHNTVHTSNIIEQISLEFRKTKTKAITGMYSSPVTADQNNAISQSEFEAIIAYYNMYSETPV